MGKVFRFLANIQVKEEKKDVHVRTIILTDFSVFANRLCMLHDLFEKFLLLPTFTIGKKKRKEGGVLVGRLILSESSIKISSNLLRGKTVTTGVYNRFLILSGSKSKKKNSTIEMERKG